MCLLLCGVNTFLYISLILVFGCSRCKLVDFLVMSIVQLTLLFGPIHCKFFLTSVKCEFLQFYLKEGWVCREWFPLWSDFLSFLFIIYLFLFNRTFIDNRIYFLTNFSCINMINDNNNNNNNFVFAFGF